MSVTFESIRFGTVEIDPEDVIEFPFGLIGLGGLRYTLLDRNPGSGFLWLHAVDEPALALPVVSPHQFFSTFTLEIAPEDRERTGIEDATGAQLYVTVRATPNPADITANLRAPLLIIDGRGYQVLNTHEDAELQAPLFALPAESRIAS
jgi:flagellar assembly factor FliW